jgi:hypothetical protein
LRFRDDGMGLRRFDGVAGDLERGHFEGIGACDRLTHG